MTEVYLIIQHCDFSYGYGVVEEEDIENVVRDVSKEHEIWHLRLDERGPMCNVTYETIEPGTQLET